MVNKKYCFVLQEECVACGCCKKVCPKAAIAIIAGMYAQIDKEKCIACKLCLKECPASVITVREDEQ